MRKKNLEFTDEIIKLYKEGLSCEAISKHFEKKFSATHVRNVLKDNNVPMRTKGGCTIIDESILIDMYVNQKMSLQDIADKTGRKSLESIRQIMLKNNIPLRNRAALSKKDTTLNEDFFEMIDTEFKAYILGFLITDGNVSERTNSQPRIRIQIHDKDEYILEEFKKQLNSSNKINHFNEDKRKNHVELCVHSQKMFDDLSNYGVVPNKTWNTYLPDNIPNDLISHLIRGIMDGDGWIAKKDAFIGFIGTNKLMHQIKDQIQSELSIEGKICIKNDDTELSELWYADNNSKKLMYHYLYDNANYYLVRKKDNLENFLKDKGLLD